MNSYFSSLSESAAISAGPPKPAPSPPDSMTEPIFGKVRFFVQLHILSLYYIADKRVKLAHLGCIEYGGRNFRIKTELAPHWQDLAPHLGISPAEIETIKKNAQYQHDDATTAMFRKWMQKVSDHTWRNLIKAMKKVDLNALADDLTKALCHSPPE